jgi:alpha-beta hydrolase superfamily lysophospholipase
MSRHTFTRLAKSIVSLVSLLFLGLSLFELSSGLAHAVTLHTRQDKTVDLTWKAGCQVIPPISVALVPGTERIYKIAATLCEPTHPTQTILITYHGSTYGQYYWNLPYQPSTYSFVDSMNKAGYAVLNIDRIGDGQSSHPTSDLVTVQSDSYTLHQVVQDLRGGGIAHTSFSRVILATHSLGGYISWYAAAMYPQDFDGIIETGAIHHNSTTRDNIAIPLFYHAADDPKFKQSSLDQGYYTSKPGIRSQIYYHQVASTDPNVAKIDETLKQTNVLNELIQGIDLATTHTSNMIHVPVLTVLGQDDFFACAPDGMDCSTAKTIKQAEASFYAADACLQAYDLANAGHDINLAPNAQQWYDFAETWIATFIEHHQPGCGTRQQNVPLPQLATVSIPGTPASNWCYDTAVVDGGTYYLADNDRAGIDLIRDGKQPAYQGIIGKGQFTGIGGCKSGNYDKNGPEGIVIAHDQIFAGDGNSSVRVYSSETGQFITRIGTGGHLRSDEITYDARDQLVIVANGSERDSSKQDAPFLSFISTKQGKTFDQIVKTLKLPHAYALEQPIWNPYDGKLYLAVPSSDQNISGEVDVIDPITLSVTSIATPNCEDAGLALANPDLAAVGCATGDQIVLDMHTHKLIRVPITSVDIVAASKHFLYYASYGSDSQAPQLAVADFNGHLLQTLPIASVSHTVTVDDNGHVFVPLDGGRVAVFEETHQYHSPDTSFVVGDTSPSSNTEKGQVHA